MEALVLRDLHAYYGKAHVLHGIDLTAPASSVIGVLGRNGAGKTTLLKSVMGMVPRITGEVYLHGQSLRGLSTDATARAGIAFMPQGLRCFPGLTVEENCRVAASAAPSPRPLSQILEILPELEPLLRRRAGSLSGGQQQLAALARSLTMRCKVLLMDEPTEGIMPKLLPRLTELARAVASQGVAVIIVEQNVRLALDTCDHIYVLDKGQIKAFGTPRELLVEAVLDRYVGVAVMETGG